MIDRLKDNVAQGASESRRASVPSVRLNRQVTVKTLVTDVFRERAHQEL